MIFAVVLAFIALATILGNTFCLLVLRKNIEGISETVSIFMKSLTIADLLTGIFAITPSIGPAVMDIWPYSYSFCIVSAFVQTILNISSVLSLTAVNVERYIAIEFPLHYTTVATANKARVVVISIWTIAVGWACLHAFRPGQVAVYHPALCQCVADPTDPDANDITSIVMALGFFFFPCIATVCLFLRLYCISMTHARRIAADESVLNGAVNNAMIRFRSTEFRISVTFFILTLIFLGTYIPVSILIAMDSSGVATEKLVVTEIAIAFWRSNSCINVFVYSVRNKSFRRRVKEILGIGQREDERTSRMSINPIHG